VSAVPVTVLSPEAVRPLRRLVLRPHQTVDELAFEGDHHPLALHVGSVVGGTLVAVASIAPQPHPNAAWHGDWRLRGMATLPEARGAGSGRALLSACLEHALIHGGSRVWCHARTGALRFYERFGFEAEGDPFVVPAIGPHVRMVRAL
jgi:GNAT superfamily N-acetyltransferase